MRSYHIIESTPRLTEVVEWIKIDNIPIFNNEISIKCLGNKEVTFINKGKDTVLWKAVFFTNPNEFMVDATKVKAQKEEKSNGSKCSYVVIPVHENEQHHVKII